MQAASSAKTSEGRASLLAQRVSVRLAMHRAWGPCLVWGEPRAGEQLRPGATATELSLGPGATTTERGAPEPVTDGAPVSEQPGHGNESSRALHIREEPPQQQRRGGGGQRKKQKLSGQEGPAGRGGVAHPRALSRWTRKPSSPNLVNIS